MFDVQHRDERVPLKEWVLGVEVDAHKAYPISALAQRVDGKGELLDTVGGRKLRIHYHAVHRSGEAFDERGQAWPGTMAYWFAWVAFHPRTAVLGRP